MGTTTKFALRYPELTDQPKVQQDLKNLATDSDAAIPQSGVPAGYAPLDGSSKIPISYIPAGVGLPADTVVVAGTRIISNKLLAGDAQPSWQVLGSGQFNWGPGGATATDTNLYRSAAATLRTDQAFYVGQSLTTIQGIYSAGNYTQRAAIGDSQPIIALNKDLKGAGLHGLIFGLGGASGVDVNLWRAASGTLQTDGIMQMGGGIVSAGNYTQRIALADSQPVIALNRDYKGAGQHGLIMGLGGASGVDTNLYRSSAGLLKTDGQFYAVSTIQSDVDIYARVGTTRVQVGAAGPGAVAGIAFGATVTTDTNLYRSAAGWLQTDGVLIAKQGFYAPLASPGNAAMQVIAAGDSNNRFTFGGDGKMTWGPGNAAVDTNLYRSAAGQLKTDGYFYAVQAIYAMQGTSTQVGLVAVSGSQAGLSFGSAGDTNLYRVVAGVLQTDGRMTAVGLGGIIYHAAPPNTGSYPFYYRPSTDTQPTFTIDGTGGLNWGPGGTTAPDTSLSRVAANVLRTTAAFQVLSPGYVWSNGGFAFVGTDVTSWAFWTQVTGDSNSRFVATTAGALNWGPGNAGTDVTLYRAGPGDLRAAGQFDATNELVARVGDATYQAVMGYTAIPSYGGAGAGIKLNDSTIVRYGTKFLMTDAQFWSHSSIVSVQGGDGWPRAVINNDSSICFGPGNGGVDTRIMRTSGGRLVMGENGYGAGGEFRVQGSTLPRFSLYDTGGIANQRKWQWYLEDSTSYLVFGNLNDAENAQVTALKLQPNGSVQVGNNLSVNGTALIVGGYNAVIQKGHSIFAIGAGVRSIQTITFPIAFPSAPVVTVTAGSDNDYSGDTPGRTPTVSAVIVGTPTTTSFQVQVGNFTNSATQNVHVWWAAGVP